MLLEPSWARATPSEQACISAFENAQRKQLAGKLLGARDEALSCAASSCPREVADACSKLLADIEAAVPTVVVAARVDTADLAAVRLSVDGHVVAERLDGKPLRFDPGEHTIRAEPADPQLPPKESTIVIKTGEHNRLVTIEWSQKPAPAADSAGGASIGPVPGALLTSIGGLSLVAGLTTGILALQKDGDLAERCGSIDNCPADAKPDIDELDALAGASTGTLIGGGVVAATGIVLLIVAAVTESPPPVRATGRGISIAF